VFFLGHSFFIAIFEIQYLYNEQSFCYFLFSFFNGNDAGSNAKQKGLLQN